MLQLTRDFWRVVTRTGTLRAKMPLRTNLSRTARLAHRLRVILAAASEKRINHLIGKYPKVSSEHIRQLADADPSGGKYLEWLVRNSSHFSERLLDWRGGSVLDKVNTNLVITLLTFYQKVTVSAKIAEMIGLSRDINRVGYHELLQGWIQWHDKDFSSEGQRRDRAKTEGARLLYDQDGYKVIQVGGAGTNAAVAPLAACIYGKGTQWCTSNENTAFSYLKQGPLYILLKDGMPVLQTDLREVKDPKNLHLSLTAHPDYTQILIDSGVLADPQTVWDLYHRLGLSQRWPAVEPILAQHGYIAARYALMTNKEFPLGEKAIAQDPHAALSYVVSILRRRFLEAEPTLKKDPQIWKGYNNFIHHLENPPSEESNVEPVTP